MGAISQKTGTSGPKDSLVLDHEQQDFERVVTRRLAGKFDDWPNEAGVCQFPTPRSREWILTRFTV